MRKLIIYMLSFSLVILSLAGCNTKNKQDEEANKDKSDVVNKEVSTLITNFSLELFKNSFTSKQNTLFSPLSVMLALAMCENGADGETLSQMEEMFGTSVNQLNKYLASYKEQLAVGENYKLNFANSIWINDNTISVNNDFLEINNDYYKADVFKQVFDQSTVNNMNDWVSQHTDGLISKILDKISVNAVMFLINALVFDAQWETIYTEDQITEGEFTSISGESQTVEFMNSKEYSYLESENATGFIKYYADQKYAFVALLPNEDITLDEYVESLATNELTLLIEEAESSQVNASIPKFQSEYSTELTEVMISMGMVDAFDEEKANFSKMISGDSLENIYISQIIHKTYIAVDERGTKAGAATAVQINTTSIAIEEPKSVVLDRPFIYMIIDVETSSPIFIGALTSIES